ncbi:MAG: peptide deformylase [Clostridia bacterium]|nr:peptide deformylase [Clostridia bacterium]
MVRNICRDLFILGQKAAPATEADNQLVQDLIDTLAAHKDRCVGMACNMIGVPKAIIVIAMGPFQVPMINPVIVRKTKEYKTEEGCLSLDGERECTRYEKIEVEYYDQNWQKKRNKYTGFTAQIIQHEIDHLNGIII